MTVPEKSTDNISNSCICSLKVLQFYSTWFFISIVLLGVDLITNSFFSRSDIMQYYSITVYFIGLLKADFRLLILRGNKQSYRE